MTVSEQEVKGLIRLQSDFCKRVKHELDNFRKEPQQRRTKENYQRRLDNLEKYKAEFMSNHRVIVGAVEDDDPYHENDVYTVFNEQFLEVYQSIESAINALTVSGSPQQHPPLCKRRALKMSTTHVSITYRTSTMLRIRIVLRHPHQFAIQMQPSVDRALQRMKTQAFN